MTTRISGFEKFGHEDDPDAPCVDCCSEEWCMQCAKEPCLCPCHAPSAEKTTPLSAVVVQP